MLEHAGLEVVKVFQIEECSVTKNLLQIDDLFVNVCLVVLLKRRLELSDVGNVFKGNAKWCELVFRRASTEYNKLLSINSELICIC
jgi:hypothetical protein